MKLGLISPKASIWIRVSAFVGAVCFNASAIGSDKIRLKGSVKIDGSSTVFPITEAIAEEYQNHQPRVKVTIKVSGTGSGFAKFVTQEIDISNASRKIKEKEVKKAKKVGLEYKEIAVAFDGITMVVSKKSPIDTMSYEDLKKLWEPNSKVNNWKDLNSSWPDGKIKLYGPGPENGTFDYFSKAVMGKSKRHRSDYTMTEDDNTTVRGVEQDPFAIGYFGYSYYYENRDRLKAVKILGKGRTTAVAPSMETIEDGSYPLARPIFIYVSKASAQRPEVADFVRFYLKKAPEIASQVGYVPLSQKAYDKALADFNSWRKM